MLDSRLERFEARSLSTRPDDARENEGAFASPKPDAARASVDGARDMGAGLTVGAYYLGIGRVYVVSRVHQFQ